MTSGSFTIGPSFGNYANLGAAVAAISGPLTGSLTFNVTEDYTEPAVTVDLSSIDLNGQTFTITGSADHNGNLGTGRKISFTAALLAIANPTNSSAGSKLIISNLDLICSGTQCQTVMNFAITSSANDVTVEIYDIIVDYRGIPTTATAVSGILMNFSGSHTFNAYNCLMVDLQSTSSNACFETTNIPASPNGTIENCVAIVVTSVGGNVLGFKLPSFTGTVRNCAAINLSGGGFGSTSAATGNSNMSDDSTVDDANWSVGSGNIKDITPADEFISLDPANANFMQPSSAGQANRSGTAVTIVGNNHSANTSVPRPQLTNYAIGWNEYQGAPIVTTNPDSDMITAGNTATFSVVSEFDVSYQWQEKASGASIWSDIFGATLSTYITPATVVGDHYKRFRCVITGYLSQTTTSSVAVLLIDGETVLADTPDRPTTVVKSIVDKVVTITVSGNADIYRAEIIDLDGNAVAFNERTGAGDFSVNVPLRGVSYNLVVVSGNSSSPTVWSLPGLSLGITVPPLQPASEAEFGVGVTTVPSTQVITAGPLGAGLSFPFRFSNTGAPATSYGVQHVIEGMLQILLTSVGDRIIRRDFGSVIAGKLFTPDTELGQDISAAIQSAIAENERRAEVTSVVLKRNRAAGKLFADIKFRTFRTHQDGNLVYPFEMRF